MVAAANNDPQATPMMAPKNSAKVIGAVRDTEEVKTKANKYSFHAKMVVNITTATRPGDDKGSTIRQKTWSLEHPSTIAASSNTIGTSSINVFIIHVHKLTSKAE
jgi:hypothetical protein